MLSPDHLHDLVAVNVSINSTIRPERDREDLWSPGAAAGDCEDYALTKRRYLIDLGWAPSQLLIAVVNDPLAGVHAVLIARTDQGDLVLDNLTDKVLRWDQTRLTFVSRQSERLPAMWVKL